MKPVKHSALASAILGYSPGASDPADGPARSPARALRILLAEDHPVNQMFAARLLEKQGHQVVVVANGREAVTAVARDHYDLVLMDVKMPEMVVSKRPRPFEAGRNPAPTSPSSR